MRNQCEIYRFIWNCWKAWNAKSPPVKGTSNSFAIPIYLSNQVTNPWLHKKASELWKFLAPIVKLAVPTWGHWRIESTTKCLKSFLQKHKHVVIQSTCGMFSREIGYLHKKNREKRFLNNYLPSTVYSFHWHWRVFCRKFHRTVQLRCRRKVDSSDHIFATDHFYLMIKSRFKRKKFSENRQKE